MKVKARAVTLITSLMFVPNLLFAEQLPSNTSVYTSPDMRHTINMLFNDDEINVELARRTGARRGSGPRTRPSGGYHRRPVHSKPRVTTPHRAVHRHTYRTIRGRRMRLYVVGTGIAIATGDVCYVDEHRSGEISRGKCCLGSGCYATFYVP